MTKIAEFMTQKTETYRLETETLILNFGPMFCDTSLCSELC